MKLLNRLSLPCAMIASFMVATPTLAGDIWEIHLEGPANDLQPSEEQIIELDGDLLTPPPAACGIRLENIFGYHWAEFTNAGVGMVDPGEQGTPNISSPDLIEVRRIPHLGPDCGDPAIDIADTRIDGVQVDAPLLGIGHLVVNATTRTWLDKNNAPIESTGGGCGFVECVSQQASMNGFTLETSGIWWLELSEAVLFARALEAELPDAVADANFKRRAQRMAHDLSRLLQQSAVLTLTTPGDNQRPDAKHLFRLAQLADNCATGLDGNKADGAVAMCERVVGNLLRLGREHRLAFGASQVAIAR